MRQLDHLVATLASGSTHLLEQHGLIPHLNEKLQDAASGRSQVPSTEADIIVQDSDANVLRFILGVCSLLSKLT